MPVKALGLGLGALLAAAHTAHAQTQDAEAGSASSPPSPAAAVDLVALQRQIEELERKVDIQTSKTEQLSALLPLAGFIRAFVDVGAFSVGGNGSGIRSDIGHTYYPKYAGRLAGEWVFMGDPLATAINSLGEPADASNSREDQTDTLRSGGRPSTLVNSVGLVLTREVGDGFALTSLVELLPRPGHDILDVELARIEYRPTTLYDLTMYAGKVDSVLGVEYRSQDAPSRLGVAPSLICRYTCGRPLGVEARFNRGRLSSSAALTNGDNFQDRFEAHPTLKPASAPSASAHVQWMLPVGQGLELGASGALGPQDDQPHNAIRQWHVGVDAKLRDLAGFDAAAEYVQGHQPGEDLGRLPCGTAPCLTYKGAYLLVDRVANTWLTPYVRVDWRSAVHTNGVEFVYEAHTLRATVGANLRMSRRIVGKVEYTKVRELGPTPQFPDDVLTSSLVVETD